MPGIKLTERSRYKFEQHFGKSFEDFVTVKNATETLSDASKSNYGRDLRNFFMWLNENPDQVIANRKIQLKADDETSDHYERKVRAYKKYLEKKHQTGRSIAGQIGRIQGFFANNSSHFRLELGKLNYNKARKVPKYSPDNLVCREIYSFCDSSRDRLIFVLACQYGLNPIDIAEGDWFNLPTEPFKYYESSRSKTGEIWRSVTTSELVQELAAYKKIRGEPRNSRLNPELFFKSREGFLNAAGVSQVLSALIKKAGYGDVVGFKPTAFRDGLEDAMVDAGLPNKVKEAMMGHAGDIEHQYGGQKKLEQRFVEAMQRLYPFISLTKTATMGGGLGVSVSVGDLNPEVQTLIGRLIEEKVREALQKSGAAGV
ncbi:hypothetical protein [Candidatus Bathycorpusculum sp.]|uniref:hypothetical protein n=1 Tax=Candidatus Bathycorpusculum sp. TaxID=2994959 RepID=UPI00282145BF|nr:hypothetical protein [Candidatus Termitimicrobium sp.]MCL2431519.1 hypothetical protein [Candidatus Termitimicrobium sp.]